MTCSNWMTSSPFVSMTKIGEAKIQETYSCSPAKIRPKCSIGPRHSMCFCGSSSYNILLSSFRIPNPCLGWHAETHSMDYKTMPQLKQPFLHYEALTSHLQSLPYWTQLPMRVIPNVEVLCSWEPDCEVLWFDVDA